MPRAGQRVEQVQADKESCETFARAFRDPGAPFGTGAAGSAIGGYYGLMGGRVADGSLGALSGYSYGASAGTLAGLLGGAVAEEDAYLNRYGACMSQLGYSVGGAGFVSCTGDPGTDPAICEEMEDLARSIRRPRAQPSEPRYGCNGDPRIPCE